ncbi:MAG: hypothetical protein ACI4O7_02360 [Aristaeellaceae bacterium]
MSRTARLTLCLMAALLVLTGCAGGTPEKTSEPQPRLDISIGFWNIDRMNDVQQDAMREYMESMLNISVTPVSVDWVNYKEYYQMLSATDSLPDVFTTLTISSNDANDTAFYEHLIETGRIQPLPEDLSAYPNLERTMALVDYTAWKDGRYYAIPRISFLDTILSSTDAAMIVRRDWMDNLGLDNPQNLDEFIALVAAFARDDPDGNGLDDTIGYNVNSLTALGKWVMLGIAPDCNTYDWIERDGRYIPSWYSEDFRQVVVAFRALYETGGLDPDFYVKNPQEVLADFAAGRLGALEYKSSPAAMQELAEVWYQYQDTPFEDCVDVLPMFPVSDGVIYCNSSLPFWSESFISSGVDEEKLDRILRLFDYLLSEEGVFMGKYGLEGIDYRWNDDGTCTLLLEAETGTLRDELNNKYPSMTLFAGLATWGGSDKDFELTEMNFIRYGEPCVVLASRSVSQAREQATPVSRPERFMIYPKESSERFSTATAFQEFVKVILGDEDPLMMWDRVIGQMREDGIEDYIQRQNDQYWLSLSRTDKGEN